MFSEKLCHCSSAFIYEPILIYLHISVKYDTILDQLAFRHYRSKAKVTFDVFTKTLSSLQNFHLMTDFDRTSQKCLVQQYLEQVCNSEF